MRVILHMTGQRICIFKNNYIKLYQPRESMSRITFTAWLNIATVIYSIYLENEYIRTFFQGKKKERAFDLHQFAPRALNFIRDTDASRCFRRGKKNSSCFPESVASQTRRSASITRSPLLHTCAGIYRRRVD